MSRPNVRCGRCRRMVQVPSRIGAQADNWTCETCFLAMPECSYESRSQMRSMGAFMAKSKKMKDR